MTTVIVIMLSFLKTYPHINPCGQSAIFMMQSADTFEWNDLSDAHILNLAMFRLVFL
ncbi:MAG: hypothetical protein OER96_04970 [Gammaproteobacteria bacterium]|nr:hypothetical protein [Gammaproteobacteria bacterium]